MRRQSASPRVAPLGRMFCMKVYRQGKETLVAASDRDVIGREFREGKYRLHVDPRFYGSEAANEEDLLAQLRLCTIANLVGRQAVNLAIQNGFVHPDNVLEIDGVLHAQMATMR